MRDTAHDPSNIVVILKYREAVEVFGTVPEVYGRIWYQVRYKNQCGYIWSLKDGSRLSLKPPK
jgi:hypothetical protein